MKKTCTVIKATITFSISNVIKDDLGKTMESVPFQCFHPGRSICCAMRTISLIEKCKDV